MRVAFSRVGWFSRHSRFTRSTILEEKWGTTRSLAWKRYSFPCIGHYRGSPPPLPPPGYRVNRKKTGKGKGEEHLASIPFSSLHLPPPLGLFPQPPLGPVRTQLLTRIGTRTILVGSGWPGRRKLLPLPQARFKGGEFATLHSHFFLPEITWIFTVDYTVSIVSDVFCKATLGNANLSLIDPTSHWNKWKTEKKSLVCLHVLKFVKVFKLDMSTYQRSFACVGGPVALQPSSLCLRSLSRFFSYLALSGALPLWSPLRPWFSHSRLHGCQRPLGKLYFLINSVLGLY